MNELFGIAGKVAIITGAGGVLGGNIAKHFMRQGAKVVAVDVRRDWTSGFLNWNNMAARLLALSVTCLMW